MKSTFYTKAILFFIAIFFSFSASAKPVKRNIATKCENLIEVDGNHPLVLRFFPSKTQLGHFAPQVWLMQNERHVASFTAAQIETKAMSENSFQVQDGMDKINDRISKSPAFQRGQKLKVCVDNLKELVEAYIAPGGMPFGGAIESGMVEGAFPNL